MTATKPRLTESSSTPHHPDDSVAAQTAATQDESGGICLSEEILAGGPVIDSGLPFGMQVDTYAEGTIKALLKERELLKREFARQKKVYKDLESRVCKAAANDVDLPAEVGRRLNRLENDVEHYLAENKVLSDGLKATQSEVADLEDAIASQKNKPKGADRQVRNAKEVADKQQEKAKSAVQDKKLRDLSKRKMKQERKEAIAEVSRLVQLWGDLQADLSYMPFGRRDGGLHPHQPDRAGEPHLRVDDPASGFGVAVIPVGGSIERAHTQKLAAVFKSDQISTTQHMQQWHTDWKKPKQPSRQVAGANYVDKKEDKGRMDLNKLYADMVGLVDGHEQTGAEHDGWRSTHNTQTTCRKAQKRANEGS
ncbi:TRAPP subunit trs31 [Didymella heteroderae]|uniref:TRAPP subunit trs31 n=1 Tax=Didymella heteroderae TaxID=1769908 RepID=A0A9P5BV58_9PLEO|nr:TRAPP subunit trs31 [Didymella heteroderae]